MRVPLAILAALATVCLLFHDFLPLVHALEEQEATRAEDEILDNPFHCTMSASSHDSCVQLNKCAWCQGEGLPGICVSQYQEKALIHKLPKVKCFDDEAMKTPKVFRSSRSPTAHYSSQPNISPYDPECLNAPSSVALDDDPAKICDTTTDSQGDVCTWCDAAGVFGLCLSSDQAEKASNYLNCDLAQSI